MDPLDENKKNNYIKKTRHKRPRYVDTLQQETIPPPTLVRIPAA